MKDKAQQYLVDWTIDFLKNRDLFLKKIESIEKNKKDFDIYIKFKHKEQFFIVKPAIKDINEISSYFDEEGYFGLVMFNTQDNFDVLIKNWDRFVEYKHLCVYFVNPFSQSDKKWIIYPHTHDNICEKNALRKGLRSIFQMVEPLTEEQIKDKFK